ncbi:uncharacterized protein LOC62_04G005312 [Vanrija pseudolonga]|uniref:Uncharacterized protein n=1 Tax=Vanrija pseudolonga TaxID=143232 RepID=A0AAF1BI20_9TREE|nr:hypothetical protein LOC62_04G005312 [Vanrija pseudolonga]
MAPVLDHTSYPLLIDEIVAAAPVSSLLELRRTSKAFRDRVDALLVSHAVLALKDGAPALYIPKGHDGAGKRLPYVPGHVSTLDVDVSTTRRDDLDRAQLDAYTSLRVLRRFGLPPGNDAPRFVTHDTLAHVVDYLLLGSQRGSRSVRFNTAGETHVVHLRWNELAPSRTHFAVTVSPATKELVFVLHPFSRPDRWTNIMEATPERPLFTGLINTLSSLIFARRWGQVQCTIVGLENVHPNTIPPGEHVMEPFNRPGLAAGAAAFRAAFARTLNASQAVRGVQETVDSLL